VNLDDCLPDDLRPATITRIGVGMSGAGVYRVAAPNATYVLKVSAASQPIEAWRAKIAIQRTAAAVGIAPAVVHVDETRRAVVTDHIVDRGFPVRLMTPATREAAIGELGQALRRVHDLSLPAGTPSVAPRDGLASLRAGLAGFALPAFVHRQIDDMLAESPPAQRVLVLSHNDVNPSNIAFDGERVILLDWDAAGPNDAYYDLASAALFFRFDDATCAKLIAAHDGSLANGTLPERFRYLRRLVATLCGTMMTHLARQAGHPGTSGESLESAPSLLDIYGQLRAGAIDLSTGDGRWQFGLALVKTATTI
jgi:aminoglycoside phosphotransferase